MSAEWDALTDRHCFICGPEPGYYTRAENPWPLIWLHDHCKPEHERRQQASFAAAHNITIELASPVVYPESRAWLDEYIRRM